MRLGILVIFVAVFVVGCDSPFSAEGVAKKKYDQLKSENKALAEENERLMEENEKLREQLERIKEDSDRITDMLTIDIPLETSLNGRATQS